MKSSSVFWLLGMVVSGVIAFVMFAISDQYNRAGNSVQEYRYGFVYVAFLAAAFGCHWMYQREEKC